MKFRVGWINRMSGFFKYVFSLVNIRLELRCLFYYRSFNDLKHLN